MGKNEVLKRITRACENANGSSSDFDLNPGYSRPINTKLRPAAVLLALHQQSKGIVLILTKRAAHLRHHPGQIAFPGGKVDLVDPSSEAAALREAEEEIGLARKNVEVIATLPDHETVTGFTVSPILGWIREGFQAIPEKNEVDEVFSVPFDFLTDTANFSIEYRYWGGEKRYYYTCSYGPYYIWGATARILYGLAEGMSK